MKRNHLLLSHLALFSVGLAVAWVAKPAGTTDGDAAAAEARARAGMRGAAGLGGGDIAERSRLRRGAEERAAAGAKAGGDRAARLEQIRNMADPMERQRALLAFIDQLGPGEFEAVAEQYRTMHHLGGGGDEYSMLLRGWAKVDPLGALAFVEKHPNAQHGRSRILESWAGRDAAAAEAWAIANHEGDGPNPHMASVIAGIAPHDIGHATRLIEAMPNSRERGAAVAEMTRALLVAGVDAAKAFPETIADPQLRGGFVNEIANRIARQDPQDAANWLASLGEGEMQRRAARGVGEALARQDQSKAAAWVSQLKPEARAEAAVAVIPILSSGDIEGTARWVNTLAGTPDYDRAVEAFVWSCDQRAPEQSAAWIRAVANQDQQRRLYHRMLGTWAGRDANAVRQWVVANDVPEDIRRRFAR